MPPLIGTGTPPIHWSIAGAVIALVTLCLLFFGNRRLGVSSGFEDLCSLVLQQPYFKRDFVRTGRLWRLPFLAGLVLGGFLSAASSGGWHPTWQLGIFDARIGFGTAGKTLWMFAGGVLIGFGTRLAGGCTSGHGIFGVSNFEKPSLVTMVSFMLGGILASHLVYRVLFP